MVQLRSNSPRPIKFDSIQIIIIWTVLFQLQPQISSNSDSMFFEWLVSESFYFPINNVFLKTYSSGARKSPEPIHFEHYSYSLFGNNGSIASTTDRYHLKYFNNWFQDAASIVYSLSLRCHKKYTLFLLPASTSLPLSIPKKWPNNGYTQVSG